MTVSMVTPHAHITRQTRGLIFCAWAFSILLYWQVSASPAIPRPMEIIYALRDMWQEGELLYAFRVSFATNLEALLWTTVFTLGFSYLTVVPFFRDIVGFLAALRFLSMAGLIVMFILIFSNDHAIKVAMLTFGMTTFSLTQLHDDITSIPKEQLDDARTLRMGPWRVVWEVIVLGRMHAALVILRQNAAMGWSMLTMAEGILRSEGGIGPLLLDNRKHFNYGVVFAIQTSVLLVGLLQDHGLAVLTRTLCPYAYLKEEKR